MRAAPQLSGRPKATGRSGSRGAPPPRRGPLLYFFVFSTLSSPFWAIGTTVVSGQLSTLRLHGLGLALLPANITPAWAIGQRGDDDQDEADTGHHAIRWLYRRRPPAGPSATATATP